MLSTARKLRKWFLEGKSKNNTRWIIPVDKSPFVIGRSGSSDLVLSSKIVSRRHAEIITHTEDNMVYLNDLNSTNGSYLNRQRIIKRTFVDPGDCFQFGEFEFKLIYKESSEENTSDTSNNQTQTSKSPLMVEDFAKYHNLTKREEEIMHYIMEGKSTKEIAYELNISFGTAKNHIYNLFQKIGIHSRIELVARYNSFSD